jgi:hypothetical protein
MLTKQLKSRISAVAPRQTRFFINDFRKAIAACWKERVRGGKEGKLSGAASPPKRRGRALRKATATAPAEMLARIAALQKSRGIPEVPEFRTTIASDFARAPKKRMHLIARDKQIVSKGLFSTRDIANDWSFIAGAVWNGYHD